MPESKKVTPKQQLFSFRTLVLNIRTTERALRKVRARLYDIPAIVGETVKSHPEDRKPEILTSIDDLAAELSAMNEERRIRLMDVTPIMMRLTAPKENAVIKYRYLMAMDWEAIAEILFGEEQDFKRGRKRYEQRCYKIHSEAMTNISLQNKKY